MLYTETEILKVKVCGICLKEYDLFSRKKSQREVYFLKVDYGQPLVDLVKRSILNPQGN